MNPHLIKGLLYGLIAQILTFIQLQGPLKWPLFKQYQNWLALAGVPIAMLFMRSVQEFVIAFDGTIWPSRLIGFAVGIIVFSVMSIMMFGESLNPKTTVCIVLGMLILVIQLTWK
jgi:multidrug transporter EmrE-like cation transporter